MDINALSMDFGNGIYIFLIYFLFFHENSVFFNHRLFLDILTFFVIFVAQVLIRISSVNAILFFM